MRLKFYTSIMMLALGLGQVWADVPTIASNEAMDKYVSSLNLQNLAANSQLQYVNFDAESNEYSLPANVVAKNSKGEWYADEIVLTNAKEYTANEDVYAESITYNRSFTEGVLKLWQPLYVPFGFNPAEYSDDFDIAEIFTICPTRDSNDDGIIDGSDDIQMIVTIVKDGTTKPNVPYLIRPKRVGNHSIVGEGILKAASEESIEFSSTRSAYKITGVYKTKVLMPQDGNYYLDGNAKLVQRGSKAANYTANKWLLNYETREYGEHSSLIGFIPNTRAINLSIKVLGEDIEDASTVELNENGKENSIFTINGKRIQSLDGVPAGIYIVNGKKVIKK